MDPRRSISIRGATYRDLMAHCKASGVSASQFAEARIAEWFAAKAPARESVIAPTPARPNPRGKTPPRSIAEVFMGRMGETRYPTVLPRPATVLQVPLSAPSTSVAPVGRPRSTTVVTKRPKYDPFDRGA